MTHKVVPLLAPPEWARLVVVGDVEHRLLRDAMHDDEGDNIASKNRYYSELTGMYRLWRNCRDAVIGVCHYRRLFVNTRIPWCFDRSVAVSRIPEFDYPRVEGDLLRGDYDAVLPTARILITRAGLKTIRGHFVHHQGSKLFGELVEALSAHDAAMARRFQAHVATARRGSYWNMIIARREVYCTLCEWLFGIMSAVERRLARWPDGVPVRSLGYLSESLIGFYLGELRCRVRPMNVVLVKGV